MCDATAAVVAMPDGMGRSTAERLLHYFYTDALPDGEANTEEMVLLLQAAVYFGAPR
jgi:hypothetical protein